MQEELTLSVQGEKQPGQDGHMQEGPAVIKPHDGNTQITSCHLPVAVNSSGKCSSEHSIFLAERNRNADVEVGVI